MNAIKQFDVGGLYSISKIKNFKSFRSSKYTSTLFDKLKFLTSTLQVVFHAYFIQRIEDVCIFRNTCVKLPVSSRATISFQHYA